MAKQSETKKESESPKINKPNGGRVQQGAPELVPHHPQAQGDRRGQFVQIQRSHHPDLGSRRSPPTPPAHAGEEGGEERSPSARIVRSPTPGPDAEWVISIREKLEQARQVDSACPWAKLSIYRVPKSLREGDERSYVPQVVSLGPFHHGRRRLRDMEPHKWRALHCVLGRTGHDVRAYLDAVRPLEDRVRACYEGGARGLPSNELVLSLVLDGTFALELFRGAASGEEGGFAALGYSRRDPVFAMRGPCTPCSAT
uniref:Uncharacterized protein n=1 Tax=Ananas comosus var. bracteatus TaxID=296719 RepID=A0A6V7P2S7_ANACO|nr:unnamed protein product [Ananas comosus var. bracteatus]